MQLPAASGSSARISGQSNAVTGPALRLDECEIERGPSVLFLRATIYARTHILHGHCALFPSRLCSRNHRSFPDHLSHFYFPTKRATVAAYSARGGSYHAGRRERFSTRIKGLPSTYSSGPYSEAKGKRSSRNLRRVGGSFSEERGRFLSASFSSPPPDPLFPGTKFPRAAGAHPAKGLPTDWKFERTKPSQTISVLRIALFLLSTAAPALETGSRFQFKCPARKHSLLCSLQVGECSRVYISTFPAQNYVKREQEQSIFIFSASLAIRLQRKPFKPV